MSDEDDVWARILENAEQLTFPEWEWDIDEYTKPSKRDDKWCSCETKHEVKVMILHEVVPTCSARLGGCSKEIHPDDWED